jgi:DGQHR domain-containing protein
MGHSVITKIAHFDVRRIAKEAREIETYLGIQRPLDERRVAEIGDYVNFQDASFPSSIIIAVNEEYASFSDNGVLSLRNFKIGEQVPSTAIGDVARVLDGQHRIAGLERYRGEAFDVIVTIFVGADISDQAYIFATVNLEQRKVNRSLAYDLFALAKSRSPQKTCHNIAVAFDQDPDGPFHRRIKRLGIATPGRDFETITQATFVDGIMPSRQSLGRNEADKSFGMSDSLPPAVRIMASVIVNDRRASQSSSNSVGWLSARMVAALR